MKFHFKLICFYILTGIPLHVSAQEVTVYGQTSLWHATDLCNMEFTCNYRDYLPDGQVNIGYAYHPNGSLWHISTNTSGQFRHVYIYKVDQSQCQYSLLYDISLPEKWNLIGAANIDHLGRLYMHIHKWNELEGNRSMALCRISDFNNPILETLIDFDRDVESRFWEVHFTAEKIYLVATQVPRIWVYNWSFIPVDTIHTAKHIWGLTSFSMGCDSIITYATHMGYSTEEFFQVGPDTMMYISKYNLESNTLTPVCQYWMGDKMANTNMTSPLEFLAADPECELLMDLDRDNSTGVYPYDYLDSTFYCATVEAPICDPDVYIHSSAPLDSILLIISGIKEEGDEQLISIGLPSSVSLSQQNDSTYVLKSTIPTDDIFQLALKSLRYEHSGMQRTPGQRKIIVQGFNVIKAGVKISATIHISGLPFAGHDQALLICTDTVIQDLVGMTGGQSGGYWSPLLLTGGSVFNSALDMADAYKYIVIDPACGNDTAIVTVHRDASTPTDLLGADQVICPGDTIQALVTHSAQSLLWEDGNTDPVRALTNAGTYWVILETSGGCYYKDSLIITNAESWDPTIQTQDPVCNLPNGQIVFDLTEFEQNESVLINGVPLVSSTLESLAEGTYEVTAISNDGCISQIQVILTTQPTLTIAMDTQITVLHGLWTQIEYVEHSTVSLSDVLFDPPTSIRWTGNAIEVYGDLDQQFEITFVDENGCIDVHLLQVLVEKEQGIYLPNIFRPGSTTINAIWQPSISESYQLEVLRIYDRWGNMMFQSTMDALWDGTRDGHECPSGVFVYQLILTNLGTNERKILTGDISLIR